MKTDEEYAQLALGTIAGRLEPRYLKISTVVVEGLKIVFAQMRADCAGVAVDKIDIAPNRELWNLACVQVAKAILDSN